MSDKMKKIEKSVLELKNLGKILIPYNYPISNSNLYEDDLVILKTRLFVIDGYSIVAHYQRCDYDDCYMDVLQIYGDYSNFLPISVSCKMAKLFLGESELFLIETYKESKKIYCWTVYLDKDGNVIKSPSEDEGDLPYRYYDDFKYFYVPPNKVFFI